MSHLKNQSSRPQNWGTPWLIQEASQVFTGRHDRNWPDPNGGKPWSDQLWKAPSYLDQLFNHSLGIITVLLPFQNTHSFSFFFLGYGVSRRWKVLPPPNPLHFIIFSVQPPCRVQCGVGRIKGKRAQWDPLTQGASRVTGVAAGSAPFSGHNKSPPAFSSLYHQSYLSYDRLKKDSEGSCASN